MIRCGAGLWLCALLSLAGFSASPRVAAQSTPDPSWKRDDDLIFLHRGARFDAPEGTLASAHWAYERGADGIEVDLRVSADAVLVCYHDKNTVLKGRGFAAIDELCSEEIVELDAGSWFHSDFADARVLPFEDLLRFCVANGLLIRLDLKDLRALPLFEEMMDRYEAWPLLGSSITGHLRERIVAPHPWLAKDLWMSGRDADPLALAALIEAHPLPFRVTVDDPRILTRLLGRDPSKRSPRKPAAPRRPLKVSHESDLRLVQNGSGPACRVAASRMARGQPLRFQELLLGRIDAPELWPAIAELPEAQRKSCLTRLEQQDDLAAQRAALILRGRLGLGDSKLLRERLSAEEPSLRAAAIWVCARLALTDFLPEIRSILAADPEIEPRIHAALALGSLGSGAADRDALQAALASTNQPLAFAALAALPDLGWELAAPALRGVLFDPRLKAMPSFVLVDVVQSLSRLGPKGDRVLLERLLASPPPLLRRELVFRLASCDAAIDAPLIEAAQEGESEAILVLGLRAPKALRALDLESRVPAGPSVGALLGFFGIADDSRLAPRALAQRRANSGN